MKDIGEIKGSIKIDGGKMELKLSERQRMKLIRRLAVVSGPAYVDPDGYMTVLFDLGAEQREEYTDEEEEAVEEKPIPNTGNLVSEHKKEKETPEGEHLELFEGFLGGEDIGIDDFSDKVEDSNVEGDKRSIEDLTTSDKEYLVSQYIKDIPTTAIMGAENITKSALYSSLERERIPRKGKLNRIIRELDDGASSVMVAREYDVDMEVIGRIISTLGL